METAKLIFWMRQAAARSSSFAQRWIMNASAKKLEELEKTLLDINARDRWIPVTERLPDLIPCNAGTAYSEAVIVWTSNQKVMIAVWDGVVFLCPVDYWEAWDEQITHWKPVPKPPVDGEESCKNRKEIIMAKKKKPVAAPAPKQPAMKKVCHKGYTAVQSNRNFHVMIGKDGKMVSHASVNHPMTEDELRQSIEEYIAFAGKVGVLPDAEAEREDG